MKVILLERVDKLGQMGDEVNVKPGYARNFLLPQKKALRSTEENKALFETRRAQLEVSNLERRKDAEAVASRLDGLSVIIVRQASESDHLYGSVTTRDIAEAVTEAGFTLDKRQIRLDRPIKSVAMHPVRVNLHPEVAVTVTVNVARSVEEAEARARGESLTADEDESIATADLFEEGAIPELEPEGAGAGETAETGDEEGDGR